ncbi:MAG: response regulator [Mariprofundaceae bacterium]|nr:response regulator [Mariprofundaceae bacterium]
MSILVTDDSTFIRKRICKIILDAGYETIEAANGNLCLKAIAAYQPECVFLDLIMPEMSGIEVLQILQHQSNTPPIVVLTADIQSSVQQQCLALGAFAFLNKPPQPQDIQAMLTQILSPAC